MTTLKERRLEVPKPHFPREDAAAYRGLSARLNYLAQDRADLQFAARGAAKRMSNPRPSDWLLLKKVGRYLVGKPRMVQMFAWQDFPGIVDGFLRQSVGKRSRRSQIHQWRRTANWNAHVENVDSTTQQIIALSSGEAELYAVVKGVRTSKGLVLDFARPWFLMLKHAFRQMHAQLSGMAHRQGLGRTRHTDVQHLWIQNEVASGKVHNTRKVETTSNPADSFTKCLPSHVIESHSGVLAFVHSKFAVRRFFEVACVTL